MAGPELTFSLLDQSCPYFLYLDRTGRIIQFGSNYKFSIPEISIGSAFEDWFEWEGQFSLEKAFAAPKGKGVNLVFLRTRNGSLRFKAGYHCQDDYVVLLGSPVINSQTLISAFGITLKEIPRHDYLSEYVFLQETSEATLRGVRAKQ